MLLTDDGELTFRLTHARFGVEKEYHAQVACSEPDVEQLKRGVQLEDGPARAVQARVARSSVNGSLVKVVLVDGRQRQVRRMLDAIGCPVQRLVRVRIGPLLLGDLPLGTHRELRAREVAALRECVGLDA